VSISYWFVVFGRTVDIQLETDRTIRVRLLDHVDNECDGEVAESLKLNTKVGSLVDRHLLNVVVEDNFVFAKSLDLSRQRVRHCFYVGRERHTEGGANRMWKWCSLSCSH
jgi:hypothetical protein